MIIPTETDKCTMCGVRSVLTFWLKSPDDLRKARRGSGLIDSTQLWGASSLAE